MRVEVWGDNEREVMRDMKDLAAAGYVLAVLVLAFWNSGVLGGAGWQNLWQVAGLGLGLALGWSLVYADHVIYCLTYPHEHTPMRVAGLVRERKVGEAIKLLNATTETRKRLILHSGLFQVVLALFGFWIVSSSGDAFGRGIILGMMVNFLAFNVEKLKAGAGGEIFWQIRRDVPVGEQRLVVAFLAAAFLYLTAVSLN